MNENEDVKLNAWLRIHLSSYLYGYRNNRKAPKQRVWAFVYSVIFVPIHIDLLQARKIRKIFIDMGRQELYFGVLILFLNIIFSPIVAKTSLVSLYTGVLTNLLQY